MTTEGSPKVNDQIVKVILSNLARLHTQNDQEYDDLLHFLQADYITNHVCSSVENETSTDR